MRLITLIPAVAAAPLLALAMPVLAQPAPADTAMPTCSKSVTDHCAQHSGHAAGHHSAMHHKGHHKGHHNGHHGMGHKGHHKDKAAAAKPAEPAKAK
ncbi:MAG: hypothetical protein KGM49_05730 [Sphingomonadales bacterium]|nr:hypothetical protein [Sphingomonadales bacterium]